MCLESKDISRVGW